MDEAVHVPFDADVSGSDVEKVNQLVERDGPLPRAEPKEPEAIFGGACEPFGSNAAVGCTGNEGVRSSGGADVARRTLPVGRSANRHQQPYRRNAVD
jgi:hypothetical protein